MKRFSILLPLIGALAYTQIASAYSTSATVLAGANAAYGSQNYDSDFDKVDIDNAAATANASAQYNVRDTNTGAITFQYSASATGIASPGVLKASAYANASAYADNLANSQAVVSFADSLTLVGPTGSGSTEVTLSYLVSGGVSGSASAKGQASFDSGFISFTDYGYAPRSFTCSYTPNCGGVSTFSVRTNTPIDLFASLEVAASASSYFKPTATTSSADFGHTGLLFIEIKDDRYKLVSNSGYSYSAVPLPTAFWLFSGALGMCGVVGRRQRNRHGRAL